MKKSAFSHKLQPPFRQQKLLETGAFIRFCQEQGVTVTTTILRELAEKRVLLPAVMVHRGFVEYRRVYAEFPTTIFEKIKRKYRGKIVEKEYTKDIIAQEWRHVYKHHLTKQNGKWILGRDPDTQKTCLKVDNQTYYDFGGIHSGGEDWLNSYPDRTVYPARQGFPPEAHYTREKYEGPFATNVKQLGNPYMSFYSPHQLYALRYIERYRHFLAKEKVLRSKLQNYVVELYRFFALFNEVEELWERHNQNYEERLDNAKRVLREDLGKHKMSQTDKEKVKSAVEADTKQEAKKILDHHDIPLEKLEDIRYTFLSYGSFGLGRRRHYLYEIREKTLEVSEDPYRIVSRLNWFITLCGGHRWTIQELILQSDKYRLCPYCGTTYQAERYDQRNCGADECKEEHRNKLKEEGRKKGHYK